MANTIKNKKSSFFKLTLFFFGMIGVVIIIFSSGLFPGIHFNGLKNEILAFINQKDVNSYTNLGSKKSKNLDFKTQSKNGNSNNYIELYSSINSDFKILRKTLNPQAFRVSEIIWNIYDKNLNLENLSSSLNFEVSKNEKNQNYLEIDVFTNYDNQFATTVLQLSYFDKKTNNKIYEVTRSYDHKKKPD